jgi:hypothetical protein
MRKEQRADERGCLPYCGICRQRHEDRAVNECRHNLETVLHRVEQQLDEVSQKLEKALIHACVLKDGFDAWYWQCRNCLGHSPYVGYKPDAKREEIQHRPGCYVSECE